MYSEESVPEGALIVMYRKETYFLYGNQSELQQQQWAIEEIRSLRAWRVQGLVEVVQQVRMAARQTLAEQHQAAQQIAALGRDPLPWLAAPVAACADIQIGRVPEPPRPDVEPTDAVA
jgi:hypothetical protein